MGSGYFTWFLSILFCSHGNTGAINKLKLNKPDYSILSLSKIQDAEEVSKTLSFLIFNLFNR